MRWQNIHSPSLLEIIANFIPLNLWCDITYSRSLQATLQVLYHNTYESDFEVVYRKFTLPPEIKRKLQIFTTSIFKEAHFGKYPKKLGRKFYWIKNAAKLK